jgi:hypothetical protein
MLEFNTQPPKSGPFTSGSKIKEWINIIVLMQTGQHSNIQAISNLIFTKRFLNILSLFSLSFTGNSENFAGIR